MIDRGADLTVTDGNGDTPLHLACAEGYGYVVTVLIDRGADVNVTNDDVWTPLHRACDAGHGSVVTILIDRGADVNVADGNGETPLHWACFRGYGSIVTILIDGGADVNVADGDGQTPLHSACRLTHTNGIDDLSLEIIREVILAGGDTQARNSEGRRPVELLQAENQRGRAIYEEAVVEMESRALRPVLK
jgi:ankyrin repeat protein